MFARAAQSIAQQLAAWRMAREAERWRSLRGMAHKCSGGDGGGRQQHGGRQAATTYCVTSSAAGDINTPAGNDGSKQKCTIPAYGGGSVRAS